MLGQVIRDLIGASKPGKKDVDAATPSSDAVNPLAEYFYNNPGPGACKWHHYFEIYHRHLQKYRQRSPVVVEIGVAMGGSLPMWHHYFGPGTRVVGVDIDPACRQFEGDGTTVLIGDQGDRAFLASLREQVPHIDILIDDGGHTMVQQIATFEELYPHVDASGTYVCEDMHTSLWPNFGGGYRREGTFLEYSKGLVDKLSAWHSRDPAKLTTDAFTLMTYSMSFYDSVVVMEKRSMEPPKQFMTHHPSAPPAQDPPRFKP
jgi:cephalosporin hydroxylase